MTTLVLASLVAGSAPACSRPKPRVVVGAIVATPVATSAPATPKPTSPPAPPPASRVVPLREAKARPAPAGTSSGGIEWPWIAIADCESGDGPHAAGPPYNPHWAFHDRNYDGGRNFAYGSWDRAWHIADMDGPKDDIPPGDAWQHIAAVQVKVAKVWLAATSWEQWPVCSKAIGVA